MTQTPFHGLEEPIGDTAIAAQVLATLFEDLQCEKRGDASFYEMTAGEHRMLGFLIYDMCKRTRQIEKQFHASTEGALDD